MAEEMARVFSEAMMQELICLGVNKLESEPGGSEDGPLTMEVTNTGCIWALTCRGGRRLNSTLVSHLRNGCSTLPTAFPLEPKASLCSPSGLAAIQIQTMAPCHTDEIEKNSIYIQGILPQGRPQGCQSCHMFGGFRPGHIISLPIRKILPPKLGHEITTEILRLNEFWSRIRNSSNTIIEFHSAETQCDQGKISGLGSHES